MGEMERLSETMRRTLGGIDLPKRLVERKAIARWPAVVGELTAGRTKALYVGRGTLVVAVASSAWANELHLLKPRYLARFAEEFGGAVIRDIRFRVGASAPQDVALSLEAPSGRIEPAADLPEGDRRSIAAMAATIPDDRLRVALAGAMAASARRQAGQRSAGWVPCRRCGALYDANRPPLAALAPGFRWCAACRLESLDQR